MKRARKWTDILGAPMLDTESVMSYLIERGVLHPNSYRVELMAGGVSNIVLGATDGIRRVVVKQALSKLRVSDDWYAPESRSAVEVDSMRFLSLLTPDYVPKVLDQDQERHILVIERSPSDWRDWKTMLLDSQIEPWVARTLGKVLGEWQSRSLEPMWLPDSLESGENFEALRIDPYYRTVAERLPSVKREVLELADSLMSCRQCFVHGDFSPKNILVGPERMWVIDFEVSHRGDPVFDPAFLLSHLMLKSIHVKGQANRLMECAREFLRTYVKERGDQFAPDWRYLFQHVGCLLLARIEGKSPVEYLTDNDRESARRLGMTFLHDPPEGVNEMCERNGIVK